MSLINYSTTELEREIERRSKVERGLYYLYKAEELLNNVDKICDYEEEYDYELGIRHVTIRLVE